MYGECYIILKRKDTRNYIQLLVYLGVMDIQARKQLDEEDGTMIYELSIIKKVYFYC